MGEVPRDPDTLAEIYFRAWGERDFETLRQVLAEDVTFAGPLGTAVGAADYIDSLERLSRVVTGIRIRKRLADGSDVITWFELHTTLGEPCQVANWSRVSEGRISAVRVAFDPRPLLPRNQTHA
jgi:ketosteroid isomerase-like protein